MHREEQFCEGDIVKCTNVVNGKIQTILVCEGGLYEAEKAIQREMPQIARDTVQDIITRLVVQKHQIKQRLN